MFCVCDIIIYNKIYICLTIDKIQLKYWNRIKSPILKIFRYYCLLLIKSKVVLYTSSYLKPIVACVCETWFTIKEDDKKTFAMWEGKILKKNTREPVYGVILLPYNNDLGIYEKRYDEGLYGVYRKSNTLTYTRCERLVWLEHGRRANGDYN